MDKINIESSPIKYRRDLHRIPELGFEEFKTSEYIKNVLSNFDCKLETVMTTGLVAFFDFGKSESIAFRTDMDALPINENTTLEFKSENPGVMHACGHDGHMANMLNFAGELDKLKKQNHYEDIPFNGLLIFQPGEEKIDGAKEFAETEILDKYNVKNIYGMHLWPNLEKGKVSSKPGPMMARSTEVNVDITGLSAHCGEPEKGKDALYAACLFVDKIYAYKTSEITDPGLLSFGTMKSGNVRNAISPSARIEGSMRTFYDRTWDSLTEEMNRISLELEKEFGVNVHVDFSKGHQSVMNDSDLYKNILPALEELNYIEMPNPVMIAEDFSFFQRKRPGVFFFLGTGNGIPLHSDNFNFDESILNKGTELFMKLFQYKNQ